MNNVLPALATGAAVGIVFAVLKLPIPAPAVSEGIAGVVGIFLGAQIVRYAPRVLEAIQLWRP